jgi:hypothetical protein
MFTYTARRAATTRPVPDQTLDQLRPDDTWSSGSWTGWAGLEGRIGDLT